MIREKYFSFEGRLNRQPYWLRSLMLLAIFIALVAVLGGAIGGLGALVGDALPDFGGPVAIIALVVGVVALVAFILSTCSIAVRRLHDRNKSGWWLLLFYVLPNFLSGDTGFFGPVDSGLAIVVTLIGAGISIWGLVEMGFLKGTVGPNEYGDDPLQPGAGDAEVFA